MIDETTIPPKVWRALRDADRWSPEQHGDELAPFAAMVAEAKPRNVLEIGVRRGGTVAVWHGIAMGRVIGIELPGDAFNEARQHELARIYPRYHGVLRDSHEPEALVAVKDRLCGAPLDLLFIDGDHSLEGVAKDFEMYAPLVQHGGFVAFHDIAPHPDSMGVHHFWRELQGDKLEFNIGAPWGGIGAVRV